MRARPFLAVLAIFASVAQASTPPQPKHIPVQPVVIVTAARIAQTVSASLADVSVITRAQIDASGMPDLTGLLRRQAGVDIVRSGGVGQQTSVFLRGSNSNQVLVLIDGVRVASANTGAYAWEQLPLDAIQRIEIVRGPRAAQWGSEAIGGVIQIFTRKLHGPHIATRVGSYGDYANSVGLGRWDTRGGVSIIVGNRNVRGFSTQNPQGFSYNPNNNGNHARNLSARSAWHFGNQILAGNLLRSDSNISFDQGLSHVIEQSAGVSLSGELAPGWSQRVSLGNDREDLATTSSYGQSLMLSQRQQADWQLEWSYAPGQQLVAGLDWIHAHGISRNTASNTDVYDGPRSNQGAYLGWYGRHNPANWELALRRDHNSLFGNATTASAAAGIKLSAYARINASFGQGFRGPSLGEQYSPGFFGYYAGNPALRPERSHSSELDLLLRPLDSLKLKLALYHTRVSDLITFAGIKNQAINLARAKMDGVEFTGSWNRGPWHARLSTSLDNARNLDNGQRLLRRPLRKADISLDRRFGTRLQAGLELFLSGPSSDYGAKLGGYSLVNAHLDWHLQHGLQLSLYLQNLAAHRYSLAYGYNTPGRSGWLTLRWNPN